MIDKLKNTMQDLWYSVADIIPKLVVAILVLIVAIILIKIILSVIKRVLQKAKLEKIDEKINQIEISEGKNLNVNLLKIILKTIKWLLYFVVFMIFTDMLELTMLSEGLKSMLGYLPQIVTGLAIFVIGLLFANFLKNSLKSLFESMELSGGKALSQIVFFIILIFVSITALNQVGVDTTIITSNITLIFGAFLVALTLAIGLGSRAIVADLLRTYYTRRKYELGQRIKFKDVVGEIVSVDDLSMTLKTETGKLIIPIKDIVENQVEIQS